MRRKMRARRDKRMFSHTAEKTKKINLGTVTYRGGIRL